MLVTGQPGTDPQWCAEYGYGLGRPDGVCVLKYRSAGPLTFDTTRDDFLHQLYWSPDGVLTTLHGFVGPQEAFWVRRAVTHEVRAADRQTVYRLLLRQTPPALTGLTAGRVSIDDEAARLIEWIGAPGRDEQEGLRARARIMAGLGRSSRDHVEHHATGRGFAMSVARELSHDPADPTSLTEWARRLNVSVKTLQRDFVREFGMPYTRWRTKLRLRSSLALLGFRPVSEVAHRVGYDSPSAFIAAFTREYGHTPGDRARHLRHEPR